MITPASSNGRTSAFEAANAGSTPAAGTTARRLWNALNAIGMNPLGKAPGMIEESC